MVKLRIEDKESFVIYGIKTWISGTDNSLFARFWDEQNKNGNIQYLKKLGIREDTSTTKSQILGLSNTEKDPNVRSFDFYIAVEIEQSHKLVDQKFETLVVNPYKWAIFSCEGNDINALMECEMYCWTHWLPNDQKYIHDYGPEMEVYFSSNKIEYWIPIVEK
jgi:predicted transcriptional regulator YdeE